MEKVSVILPALNDDENVAKIKPKLLALPMIDEVVVDDTIGLGKAVGNGIKKAKNETVCIMDCDGMHPIETLRHMIEVYFATLHRPLLVSGSRTNWERSLRGTLSYLGNWLVRTLLQLYVKDCTTGFFIGDRNELLQLPRSVWSGYGDFAIALHYEAMKKDWRVVEIPFVYGLREGGRTHTRIVKHSIQYLMRVWNLR